MIKVIIIKNKDMFKNIDKEEYIISVFLRELEVGENLVKHHNRSSL